MYKQIFMCNLNKIQSNNKFNLLRCSQTYNNKITNIRKPSARKDYFVFSLGDNQSSVSNKIQNYRDFLWKINYSNGLYVHTPNIINNGYKVFIGRGNNGLLIKSLMKRRFWWNIVNQDEQPNLVWTQLKINSIYQQQSNGIQPTSQQVINYQITDLDDPHIKIFGILDYMNWKNHYLKNYKSQEKITEQTYIKRLTLYKKKPMTQITSSSILKVHNHLQSNFSIGNKKALFYNISFYYKLSNEDPFQIIPLTFHISKGVNDKNYQKFAFYYNEIEKSKKEKSIRNMWIVKPGQNTNRGNGISVCYSLDDVNERIKGRQKNNDGKLRTFIIQKYIEKPLLYHKRKFDIRHYLLISCINGMFKAYWYEQGYIRTSSTQFTTKHSKDPFIHLTNDAIQKNSSNYGKFEKGNKISYMEFNKYLSKFKKDIDFFQNIIPKMKNIAKYSVRASYDLLDSQRKENNFQLLGMDFMIDQDFKPWLIQINTNPCLEVSCPLLERIIPNLVQNTFKICVDPLFPPPQVWQINRKAYIGQNILNQNKFVMIFDEMVEGPQLKQLYKDVERIDSNMGDIEEDSQFFQNQGEEIQEQKC